MNELYARFRDKGFQFFTIYVREPHPGEHYHEHHSWEQKLKYARDCCEQDGIQTTLLIDDLGGTVHRAYGEMPNMVYVIDKQGKVVYKSMWTDHADIEAMLTSLVRVDELAAQGAHIRGAYTEKLTFTGGYRPAVSEKVLGRAGPKAKADFEAAIGRR